jgi:hypothetical protein
MHATRNTHLGRKMLLALAVGGFALAAPAAASEAEVTHGHFQTFAAGIERGYDITGHAVMRRTGSDTTLVNVHVQGLAPGSTYPVHVHNLPCGVNNGGGHYQHTPGGVVDPINEMWPGFTTNPAGLGNGQATHGFRARPEAQSVVIHDTDGARLACADLLP